MALQPTYTDRGVHGFSLGYDGLLLYYQLVTYSNVLNERFIPFLVFLIMSVTYLVIYDIGCCPVVVVDLKAVNPS